MNNQFEDFQYRAEELSAYIFSIDIFVISLKNGEIIRHIPKKPGDFNEWLDYHGIRNVNEGLGKMVHNFYFGKKEPKY